MRRWLGRLGGSGNKEEVEAAAVAALVADANPKKVLADAAELFCCLPASSLTADDLAGYYPNEKVQAAELRKKVVPAKLGEVTCFVSHSFQDELPDKAPGAKYEAIARWARRHEARTGVEATIWLCKACIDKDNLDVSLACLPVFVAGCQQVLVAAGPTYTGRLWCVMELFTYLRMGGDVQKVEVNMLASPDKDRAEAQQELKAQFARFDAAKAKCSSDEDTQRLLGIIEASFGDCRDFNAAAQSLFAERLNERHNVKERRSFFGHSVKERWSFFGASRRSRATTEVQLAELAPVSSARDESFESGGSDGALHARI